MNYDNLLGLKKNICVLELGTKHVTAYQNGVILHEPSLVAIKREQGLYVVGVGSKVYDLPKDVTGAVSIISPIEDGVVVNEEAAVMMVNAMLKEALGAGAFRRTTIVLSIPCGISVSERHTLENVVKRAGFGDVISAEMLTGLKRHVPEAGGMVILFGGGITEVGILNNDGIVNGCTLNIAGKTIDDKIVAQVRNAFFVKIGAGVAEKVKIEAGSLFEGDRTNAYVIGQDMIYGTPKRVEVSSVSIRPNILYCYSRILDLASSMLTTVSVATKNAILENGIFLSGGGANMRGLQEFVGSYLHMTSRIITNPDYAHLIGLYDLYSNN